MACARISSRVRHGGELRDLLDGATWLLAGEVQVVGFLQVHPEIGFHAEMAAEAQGDFSLQTNWSRTAAANI